MRKVCYFGIYDPKHWRTRIIKRALENSGYEVIECRVNPKEIYGLKKYFELYRKFKDLNTKFDFIVVGFPGYFAAVCASFITSSPIVFDAYISYFDGIRDRRDYSVWHPMMWIAWVVDFISCYRSDVVLTINEAYKDFFIKVLKINKIKVEVLHKGADEEVFHPKDNPKNKTIKVGWWGSYIPLHGLSVIVEAANLLRNKNIKFHLIGKGQLSRNIEQQIEDLNLHNVEKSAYIPQRELVDLIGSFDIVLGIFAPTPKAMRCVTNKVYEAMCAGKPIITENSPANREIFEHGKNAYLVEAGNPKDLADAIIELSTNSNLREGIGRGARTLFESRFTSKMIEAELVNILSRYHEKN